MTLTLPTLTKSLAALAVTAALTLSACSPPGEQASTSEPTTTETTDATSADFPRTVEVNGSSVTIEERPERIAVLTPEVTSLVLRIAGPERVVMASEMNPDDEELYSLAEQVPTLVAPASALDPEQILSSDPDLVLVSARHTTEHDAVTALENFGVPVADLDVEAWSDIDAISDNIETVSELLGEEELGDQMRDEIAAGRTDVAAPEPSPTVLTLMQRGPRQMIMPASAMINGLIREAGGTPVVDSLGTQGTVSADPEQIVALAPDIIIVQDYLGRGREDFAELLANPALADVPAIADNRIYYADTRTTGVTAGVDITDGLVQVSEMLN